MKYMNIHSKYMNIFLVHKFESTPLLNCCMQILLVFTFNCTYSSDIFLCKVCEGSNKGFVVINQKVGPKILNDNQSILLPFPVLLVIRT